MPALRRELERALAPGFRVVQAPKHLMIRQPDDGLLRRQNGRPWSISITGHLGKSAIDDLRNLGALR